VYGGGSVTFPAPSVDYGSYGSYDSPMIGSQSMSSPVTTEQFGAKAIRELVSTISAIPDAVAAAVTAASNSPDKLMMAIALAKEKGHPEIAAMLTERLLGKPDKDEDKNVKNVITTRAEHLHEPSALQPAPLLSGDVSGPATGVGPSTEGVGPLVAPEYPAVVPTSTHVCTNADVDETVGLNGAVPLTGFGNLRGVEQ